MANQLNWHSVWAAPAKLNLFLHVVGRREDGNHLLQTVFRFIDRADNLRFALRDDGQIIATCVLPGVTLEQDLVVRAARALKAATGIGQGVSISLNKNLPIGGGLGGGSSDAATTLIALNHLWRCRLSRDQLKQTALTLGADVPVFIHGHSAFGEGIGERLTDIDLPPAWYLVLVPPVAVSTVAIFSAPELKRDSATIAVSGWRSGMGRNDLEAVTCRRYPVVAKHLEWLHSLDGANFAAMSGSGACCFAEFAGESAARSALAAVPAEMQGFVAQGLETHPLFTLT